MRISDWSSDVCSSDLHALIGFVEICVETESEIVRTEAARSGEIAGIPAGRPLIGALARAARNARPPAVRGSAGLVGDPQRREVGAPGEAGDRGIGSAACRERACQTG